MTDDQMSFEQSKEIEQLADEMREMGMLMQPDELCRYLAMPPASLRMIRNTLKMCWENAIDEGVRHLAAIAEDRRQPVKN